LILQHDPSQIADHRENNRIIDDPRENNCARFKLDGLDPPASWFEHFKKENYGFVEQPPLPIPEAVGYIKINDFLDPRDSLGRLAQEKAHEILNNMQGKKAIVIDLRDSHGGSPEMVEFFMSYLLTDSDKSKIERGVYNKVFDASTGKTKEYKLRPTEFNLNVPVYILTNNQTFSAAEEFAYDLQQLNKYALKDNRFTVVGQSTKGGAHPMTGFPLMDANSREINSDYFLWTPDRKSENVYTHTNWEDGPKAEGKKPGVQPDFDISRNQDALQVAIESIQRKDELQSSISNRSSTALIMRLHNFVPAVLAPVQSYPLGKQNNLSATEDIASSNNTSPAPRDEKLDHSVHPDKSETVKEMKDQQNSHQQSVTSTAKSPFKNLSGTPRFTRGDN
jgi:hypothetical protein